MRLKNKIVIVTGAGSSGPGWGNGKACAVQFAREGAHIVAIDMSADAVSETEAIIKNEGGDCSVFQGDVTQSDFIDETINECIKELGKIDILQSNSHQDGTEEAQSPPFIFPTLKFIGCSVSS